MRTGNIKRMKIIRTNGESTNNNACGTKSIIDYVRENLKTAQVTEDVRV
jgi:hypothetical protein